MKREVFWSETAIAHLESIAQYIAQTSPMYAERLVGRVFSRADQFAEFPDSGRIVPEAATDDIREVFEGPYRIMYLAQTSRVDVIAVVHARQLVAWPAT
jgi:plasmid stabilization system protein ParE